MARLTVTTTPAALFAGVTASIAEEATAYAGDEYRAQSFAAFAPAGTGTVLIKRGLTSAGAPSMADAARWDFAVAMLTYTCEPGVTLWASTSSGTVDLDIVQGGQR